jgi:hypothetical protein
MANLRGLPMTGIQEHAVLFSDATSLQHRDKISFLPQVNN